MIRKLSTLFFALGLSAISVTSVQAQHTVQREQDRITLRETYVAGNGTGGVERIKSDFIPALRLIMNQVLENYKNVTDKPIRVDVLDSTHAPSNYFLSSIIPSYDAQIAIGFHFAKSAKFGGEPTAACVFQYHPQRLENLVRGYEYQRTLSRKDILYHVAFHEMGHCLLSHQTSLGNFRLVSAKEHELIADKFAFAMLYLNGQRAALPHLIHLRSLGDKNGKHYHPKELNAYLIHLDETFTYTRPDQIIHSVVDVLALATGQLTFSLNGVD